MNDEFVTISVRLPADLREKLLELSGEFAGDERMMYADWLCDVLNAAEAGNLPASRLVFLQHQLSTALVTHRYKIKRLDALLLSNDRIRRIIAWTAMMISAAELAVFFTSPTFGQRFIAAVQVVLWAGVSFLNFTDPEKVVKLFRWKRR